jgi:hypothetical protein
MRKIITAIFLFIVMTSVYGQTKTNTCDCAGKGNSETKADTTYHLGNGKTIVLCGYENQESNPKTYSEFVLSVCGQDTIIDFWGAVLTCQLYVHKDTLVIEELQNLPIGNKFKYEQTVWTREKINFARQKIIRKKECNRQIRKYSQGDIEIVLKAYQAATPGLDESKMELANKLFISAVSGSKIARKYFNEFKNKFGTLDGAFSEEYNDLCVMLELWDKKE